MNAFHLRPNLFGALTGVRVYTLSLSQKEMAASDAPANIHDHDVEVGEKNKIECKYCKKVVSGVYRLKCHLAHKCGDGRLCEEVPPSVKELMQKNVLERKRENFSRD